MFPTCADIDSVTCCILRGKQVPFRCSPDCVPLGLIVSHAWGMHRSWDFILPSSPPFCHSSLFCPTFCLVHLVSTLIFHGPPYLGFLFISTLPDVSTLSPLAFVFSLYSRPLSCVHFHISLIFHWSSFLIHNPSHDHSAVYHHTFRSNLKYCAINFSSPSIIKSHNHPLIESSILTYLKCVQFV